MKLDVEGKRAALSNVSIDLYIWVYPCMPVWKKRGVECLLIEKTEQVERKIEIEMEGVEEMEIVIVGGGICGLATALALHRFVLSS